MLVRIKVLRCSGYVNVGRMYVRLNNGSVLALYCFMYPGSQAGAGADGRLERDVGGILNE